MNTGSAASLARGFLGATGRRLAVLLLVGMPACSGLLDVKNPNNVNESDLSNPASAASQANGALSSLARAWGIVQTPYAVATDELTWIGSRDAWQTLDQGTISEPTNEFVDAAFPFVGEARWYADATIKRLAGFAARGVLPDTTDLTRVYLYGALAYIMVGDMFNNFPIGSDKTNIAPPLGPANMGQVFDTAIAYATRGIALAQATGDQDNELALTAARAVAKYQKALWALFPHPAIAGPPPAAPLINDAGPTGATADANAALALAVTLGVPDWKYRFAYSVNTVTTDIGFEVNQRLEMRIGAVYVYPDCTVSGCTTGGKTVVVDSIRLKDPITNAPDPDFTAVLAEFLGNTNHGPLTMLSAREMHLIVAEAALAAGNNPGFTTAINNLRALNSLTPYSGTPVPLAMLQYERQANLFLQGRRLLDLHRFGVRADLWAAGSEAALRPGVLFPITITELLANPYCVANPTSCE